MSYDSRVVVPIAAMVAVIGLGLVWSISRQAKEPEKSPPPPAKVVTAGRQSQPKPAERTGLVSFALPVDSPDARAGNKERKTSGDAESLARTALDGSKSPAERLEAWGKLRKEHRFSDVPNLASMLAKVSINAATDLDRKILVGIRTWLRDSDDYEAAGRILAGTFWGENDQARNNLLELQHPAFLRTVYIESAASGRETWRQQVEQSFTQAADVRTVRELALLVHKGYLPQDRALGLLDRWISAHWDGSVQDQLATWYLAADQSSTEQFLVESMLTLRAPEVLARVDLKRAAYPASPTPPKE